MYFYVYIYDTCVYIYGFCIALGPRVLLNILYVQKNYIKLRTFIVYMLYITICI